MATHGTWNSAKPVMASTYAAATNSAVRPGDRSGEANSSAKPTGTSSAPASRYGRRPPHRVDVRSDSVPTTGLRTASHSLGSSSTSDAVPAATPTTSVR